jgi:hypothetical protein
MNIALARILKSAFRIPQFSSSFFSALRPSPCFRRSLITNHCSLVTFSDTNHQSLVTSH